LDQYSTHWFHTPAETTLEALAEQQPSTTLGGNVGHQGIPAQELMGHAEGFGIVPDGSGSLHSSARLASTRSASPKPSA